MKTKLLLCICLFTFIFYLSPAQVPQGFNYQAIARDGATLIAETDIGVRIAILSGIDPDIVQWEEEHVVHTNQYGLFQFIIGQDATYIGGLVTKFTDIDWTIIPLYIRTKIDVKLKDNWVEMGDAQMVSVPYAMVSQNVSGLQKLSVSGKSDIMDEAIFAVRNNLGDTVFAVYNEGIRAHVGSAESKSKKGGFAVGSFDVSKGGQDYLRVYPDSTRIYVQNAAKGVKGGFAVGGYGTKGPAANYLNLTKENYFIGHESGLKTDGGYYNSFIGYQAGYNNTTGNKNYFIGFRAGYNNISGANNVFIGDSAGFKNNTGRFNTFIGNWTGYNNLSGYKNLILGHRAGYSNTTGICNVFLGPDAGGKNTTAWYNTFVGIGTGYKTTSGGYNSYYGINSGYAMTSGNNNAFYGSNSGYWFDGGWNNTFIGSEAGRGGPDDDPADPAGYNNTIIGAFGGYYLENASDNVLIGYSAGSSLRTGSGNVFIGNTAGSEETGSNLLYITNRTLDGDDNPVTPLLFGDFSTNHLGLNTKTLTRTMNVGGDIGATGNIYATTVYANVTGNIAGNVNGIETGRIFLSEKSVIKTLIEDTFILSWDPGSGLVVLENKNKDLLCNYWFRVVDGPSAVTGSGILNPDGKVIIIQEVIHENTGFEIHFGQAKSPTGHCSVWLQYFEGTLTGNYMKY